MGNHRHLLKALSIGCSLLISSPSWAVMVEPGQGDLSINRGQGFMPVKSQMSAKVGDSVMVAPGGSATVVYDDGCKVTVQPGAVTSIAALSPCASGSNAQGNPWECRPDQNHDCGWPAGTMAFGVVWAGTLAWIIWLITHNKNAQAQSLSNQ
jgi:hypothetical protein